MPGNNTSQDWTDDAAFWDEAWSDMEQRLDEKDSNPRAGLIWWIGGITLAILLGGGLSLASQLAWFPSATDITDSLPAATSTFRPAPATPTATPSEPAAIKTSTSPTFSEEKTVVAKATSPAQTKPRFSAAAAEPAAVLSQPLPNLSLELNTPSLPATGNQDAKAQVRPSSTAPIVDLQPAVIVPPPTSSPKKASTTIAKPVAFLAEEAIHPLTPPGSALPGISLTTSRRPAQLRLEAGGTSGFGFAKAGYYAGLNYQLPSRGKISFATSLRFRRDDIQITDIGPNDQVEAVSDQQGSPTAPTAGFDRAIAANALLRDLQASNFDELRTSGLELRVDAGYDIGKRLRLQTGLGVEYLFQASGPIITTSDSVSFEHLSGEQGFANLNVGRPTNYDLNNAALGNGGSEVATGSRAVNRLVPRAYLGLRHQLTSSIGLEASGSWLLRSIYQEDVAQIRRGQLQVGLSWRLR